MAQEKIQIKNASEALLRAQDENEIFLARLSPEELEKSGFDVSDFTPFGKVDVYLQYWDGEYSLKYRFDDDPRTDYYERPKDVGGMENFIEDIATYLSFQKKGE